MIDLEPLLRPISEAQPSGRFLRRDSIYDQIQEARRQDDDAPAGDWERKLKKSDWQAVYKLCTEALTSQTKDLQIVAWLTEALVYLQGWHGLLSGLILLRELQAQFWDSVYPPLDEEDGNTEFRARPLNWLVTQMDGAIRRIRITPDGRNWLDYYQSREIGYEHDADTSDKQERRAQAIEEKKLTAEDFDKSFYKGQWEYYKTQLGTIDSALAEIDSLDALCNDLYGDAAPAFGNVKSSVAVVQQVIENLSAKLKPAEEAVPAPESEPEQPQWVEPERPVVPTGAAAAAPARAAAPASAIGSEDAAMTAVAAAARLLRREHPGLPAPFLMLRGLRWGELRQALRSGTTLPAPSTAVRQRLKQLASSGEWQELVEAAEEAMASPEGRAWLDLQRYVVKACEELGSDYEDVAHTIRTAVRALTAEFPDWPRTELSDGTNAANAETLEWLRSIEPTPAPEQSGRTLPAAPRDIDQDAEQDGPPDVYDTALDAAVRGRRDEAIQMLSVAVREAGSGRSRFTRRVQLADICLRTGVPAVARPVLEDLVNECEERKLSEWEDPETASRPLKLLHECLVRLGGDKDRRAALIAAICRIDPVAALDLCD